MTEKSYLEWWSVWWPGALLFLYIISIISGGLDPNWLILILLAVVQVVIVVWEVVKWFINEARARSAQE